MDARIGGVPLGGRPIVVACAGERDLEALVTADGAHLVEIRADLFEAPTPARILDAVARVRAGGRPIILTARHADEGGTPMSEDARRAILAAALPQVDAIDLEIAATDALEGLRPALAAHSRTLILSAHDFAGTPPAEVLQAIIARGRGLGADVVKVATRTDTAADLRTLLAVTLADPGPALVTLGMGAFGPLSRVVLPAAGSAMAYAAVGGPTAPGQLPLEALAPILDRLYEGT